MNFEKISNYIDDHADDMVEFLSKLIQAESVNPPGDEWKAAKVLIEKFEALNIPYEIYEKEKGRTNVIGFYGEKKPSLAIVCHLDVVPAGEGWSYPPFRATVVKDRIYGRGAADDKGQIATLATAVEAFKKFNVSLDGQLLIVAVADEEKPTGCGVEYLLKECGFKPDYAIVAEQTHCESIEIAEKGVLWLKLKSKGKQAHGSHPELGVNAIKKMVKVLSRLEGFKMKYAPHPLLGEPTMNIGTINGGAAVNMVPAECEVTVDIRYLPSQTPELIVDELKALIDKIKARDPEVVVEIEILNTAPPTEVSADNELVKYLISAVKAVTGRKPKLIGIGGGTVAKFLNRAGVPSVMFGPGEEKVCHMADEYIELEQLKLGAKIFALTAMNFLRGKVAVGKIY